MAERQICHRGLRLGIIGGSALYERNGTLFCGDTFPLFVKHLSRSFRSVYYCAPVFQKNDKGDLSAETLSSLDITGEVMEIIGTYPVRTVIGYYSRLPAILVRDLIKLKDVVVASDVLFFRVPSVTTILGLVLAKAYGKPYVSYVASDVKKIALKGRKYHGLARVAAVFLASVHQRVFNYMMRRAVACICLSEEAMQRSPCINRYFSFASVVEEDAIVLREWKRMNHDAPIALIYAGRLTHEKNLSCLIHAVQGLSERGVEVRLEICGEGPERESLEKLAFELGLQKRVFFSGYVPQGERLDQCFLDNDIFVLPSISEGSPKVLLEAMAKGLVIVASNVGGIPMMVEHRKRGLLVRPESVEEIVIAVMEIVENSSLRNAMIRKGYSYVREHTANKQARRIFDIITKHVGENIPNVAKETVRD